MLDTDVRDDRRVRGEAGALNQNVGLAALPFEQTAFPRQFEVSLNAGQHFWQNRLERNYLSRSIAFFVQYFGWFLSECASAKQSK